MSKMIKGFLQDQINKEFGNIKDFMIISILGIGGKDNNRLRAELLKKKIKVRVVKNTMAIQSFGALGVKGLDKVMAGPCAIVTGGDSIVDLAKELVVWARKIKKMEIKGACLEGEALNAAQAKLVATMKTRVQQQGEVVSMALSPGARLAGAITSPAGVIAGCVKTIIENHEKQESAA